MRPRRRAARQQLTRENDVWLKDVDFQKPESLTVAGAGGTPIQYWLIKPPAFDPAKKYPVVFLIHGGPQGAWDDAWSYALESVAVGGAGLGRRRAEPARLDRLRPEVRRRDHAGLGRQGDDSISTPCSTPSASCPTSTPTKQGIAGASYGGYAVNWLITHTDRFKAAVSHDGVFNLESMALATEELWFTRHGSSAACRGAATAREQFTKFSPHRFAANLKTPTLVITNQLDFRVPVDQGLQLFTALRLQRRAERGARLRGRRALGAEGAEQQALAREGLRLDEASISEK